MSKALKRLLANDHPLFLMNIDRLERASGHAGIDVRLIGEVLDRVNSVMRQLRLDPANTTSDELYMALNATYLDDAVRAEELFSDTTFSLGDFGNGPISFNLLDIAENSQGSRPYTKRSVAHAQRKLRAELVRRYAEHERTHSDTVYALAREIGMMIDEDEQIPDDEIKHEQEKEKIMERPHILAVGDIITNAFIRLTEEHFEEFTDDKGYQRLSFELGTKLPYDGVDVVRVSECSPNAAVSVSRLGLSVDLMSWIGDDEPGSEMLSYLKDENVGTDYMVIESGLKSNYHYVLRYGADRTKLQRFEDYSYTWRAPERKPDWLYLGVLGENTWHLHEEIQKYLDGNPDIKLAFQPGMYHLMWGAEKMAAFYKRADIVVMNREEAAQVTGRDRGQMRPLIEGLHQLGVSVAVVTDGADGAYASSGDGKILFMKNFPDPAPPFERTGAGDAFASTLVAALAMGESLETALRWAPINSAYVVQKIGAQAGLLKREELEHHLANAPEDYFPTEYTGE